MLKSVVEFAAYGVAAILAAMCIFAWAWKWSGWSWSVLSRQLRRSTLAMMVALAVVATIEAQKRSGNEATGVALPREDPPVGEAALLPLPATNTLHISAIDVSTNGTVTLTAAWPEDFLAAGQTLDVLGKENLRDTTWMWLTNGVVEAGAINMSWTIENQSPSNSFYKAVVRDTLTDMDDPDGDGLPNVYERAHGRNPWVPDSALVQKLTVGTNENYATLTAALAASEPYSVIEIVPGVYELSSPVVMPSYPVMVTAAEPYAVIRSTASLGVFEINTGQNEETLFRNLYLWLGATSGFQVGFWCGGNLPWDGVPASATFDNVYVRMPNPNVQYRGWILYRRCAEPILIRNCTVNAAGATWAIGIDAYGSPPLAIDSCSFLNFPPDGAAGCGCGVFLRTSGSSDEGSDVTISRTLFDESFTNAWPFARMDYTGTYSATMSDCISPRDLPLAYLPDVSSNITVTNAMLTWSGIPTDDSPSVALGIGSLFPIPNDPLADMDGDGLSDYEEVYAHGTDPYLFDSDNDGVDDGTEILSDGTDPINTHSFKQELTVSVTNTASTAYTVYTAWGYSPTNWEENGLVAFPNGHGMNLYTNASPQGATHVKAFCDLNANGNYDVDDDILIVRAIPCGDTARFNFTFGDIDGDGLSDAQERQYGTDPYLFDSDNDGVDDRTEILDGTDPMDLHSFTQRLFVTVTNTASTAYAVYTAWGDSTRVWEANEQVIFPQGFGNTTYTNASLHGATHVKAFCDLNGNGEYDANADVLLMYQIPNGSTARIALVFGDVDGDGVPDAQERSEETDPYDGGNFRLVATVNVESSDAVPGLTNYVAWGYMSPGWEENGLDSFTGRSLPFPVDEPVTNGELFVKVFRDFNTNGVYDAGFDAFITKKLTRSDNGKTVKLSIGDSDSDHVPDSEEINESTDPLDGINYCFRLAVEVTGIFHTTNSLTLSATFGDTTPCAPTVMDTNVWSMDFGHLLATNGEKVVLTIWDDANSNLVCDVEETFCRRELGPTGHVNVVSFNMPYGNFDRNNNSLPDWWEAVNGLTSVTNGGPYADTDGDGLINLHEYWADCNPLVPDGSNTLLSVMTRMIDNRIFGKEPTSALVLFLDYLSNGTNLVRNMNFWAADLDFSCMSIWNNQWMNNSRAPVAISPSHVLMSTHWKVSNGGVLYFIGNDNVLYRDRVVSCLELSAPGRTVSETDVTVGLLEFPLPPEVAVAEVFPDNISRKIGSGKGIPVIQINQFKEALVNEIASCLPSSYAHSSFSAATLHWRQGFSHSIQLYDSGSPSFAVVNDRLVLLGLHHTATTDPSFWQLADSIQIAMDTLLPGNTNLLRKCDLSSFPDLFNFK